MKRSLRVLGLFPRWAHRALPRRAIGIALGLALPLAAWAQAGNLDVTFDGDGQVVTDVPGGPEVAYALIIQSDGKLVAAGDNSQAFQLARYNSDGSLDTGFGIGGLVATDFAPQADTARALVIQPDGKLVAGGRGNFAQALARYNPDGSLDATFGTGGTITHNILAGARVTDLALQSDGKFIASITGDFIPLGTNMRVARLNSDGSLDATFGSGGVVQIPFPAGAGRAWAVAVQPDGKILAAGDVAFADVSIARLNPDGSLDASFGTGGMVQHSATAGADIIRDIALQTDGKIVATGASAADYLTLRFNADGTLDSGFAGTGQVLTDFAGGPDDATSIQLQPDGRILVAGRARNANDDIGLARYNADGSLDAAFGAGGKVTTDNGTSANRANALVLQPDGKPVIAGTANPSGAGNNFALARYLGDDADLSLSKEASAATVTPGQNFTYTYTITNDGPSAASNVVLTDDPLPAQTTYVSCTAAGGSCANTGTGFTASYSSLPAGESRVVTLTVTLAANTPPGTVVTNTARVASDTHDSGVENNSASASVTAEAPAHTLRFYLHGNDVPGTAGGFTMNLTPPSPPVNLAVNLASAPKWNSVPTLTGTFQAGTFQLRFPCTLGLGVITTFSLHRTDASGANPQPIGSNSQLLSLCVGQTVINIPSPAQQTFSNQRLRLTVSNTLGLSLNLTLDHNSYLETPSFTGSP